MKDLMTRMKKTSNKTNLLREPVLPFCDLTANAHKIYYDACTPICIVDADNFDWALTQNPCFIFRIHGDSKDVTSIKTNINVPVFDWITLGTIESAARYICKKLEDTCMIADTTLVYVGADYARSASTRIRING